MPFIKKERREEIDSGMMSALTIEPGDICYYYYKRMMDQWRANPRWTTAHNIYIEVIESQRWLKDAQLVAARSLAWQVFFQLHVMPYEELKRKENGDI